MANRTVIPENGNAEHIIIDVVGAGRAIVACGHDYYPLDELETKERDISSDESEMDTDGICSNCVYRVTKERVRAKEWD